ncbi:helix-turn-helix domain-containing protein [Planosporangium sp. 12N6]|uniref:helix-turn-helix domain-containing protein n=1 Tax=Planosporangium spinosum TaxID=3402278 RepID=UPI003CEB8ADE
MEIDEWMLGYRIASHRVRRGLTQEELAGLVGISLSMMKKIESGDRSVTRFSQLVLFARALRLTDLRELTGVPFSLLPAERHRHPSSDAVYSALMDQGVHAAEPPDLDGLAGRIEAAWQGWQSPSAFRYDAVGQQLPELIRQVQGAVRRHVAGERRQALRLASRLYQLARTWTKRVGEHDRSLLAADRAVSCALDADDPELAAAAAWNLGMILSAQGRTAQAREVVRRAIEDLTGRMVKASRVRLAVYGSLHLLGAAEASRAGDDAEVHRLLGTATRVANATGETNCFRMVFGPTNVAVHRVAAAVELGRTGEALRLAERVPISTAPAVERRLTFHLDAARCYVWKRNNVAAVHMIQRIHQESPEELRFNTQVRDMLRELSGQAKPAVEAGLRPLLEAANMQR